MKNKAILISAVIFLAVIACSTGGILSPEPSATPAPSPTPTLAPTATPEPTLTPTPTLIPAPTEITPAYTITTTDDGWQYYLSHEFNFSLLLPPDWAVLDLSAEDLETLISAASEQNPALDSFFSSDAVKSMAAAGIKLLAVDLNVTAMASGSATNLNVAVSDLPMDISLDQYIELTILQVKNIFGEDIPVTQEKTTLAGLDAGKVTYK